MRKRIIFSVATVMALTAFAGCARKNESVEATSIETRSEGSTAAENSEKADTAAEITENTDTATEEESVKEKETAVGTDKSEIDIMNDYSNNHELLKKFPVINETPVSEGIGEQIENRLLTGFENWNRGFDAWKAWGDILYTEDSIYNVHGARLTLKEYQDAMDVTLKQMNLIMGNFNNMVICDDWAAIHYDITTVVGDKEKPGTVMEFVQFKDYGDELGTRVVEGWGGPKDDSFESMSYFQTEEEKALQQKLTDEILSYEIPDTDDLSVKYPVKNPTTANSDKADVIKDAILKDFDAYNQGMDGYASAVQELFTDDAVITVSGDRYDKAGYIDFEKNKAETVKTTKLYFDNMLISGDWAAIHYRVVTEDTNTGERKAGDKMEFFRFTDDGKVDMCYKK